MNKYNARKTIVDNIAFHSQKEANYYCELKLRRMAGDIQDFVLQPEFTLLDGFIDCTGKRQRAMKYKADFTILHNDESEEVVDVKGHKTKEYLIKKKLFLAKYPEYKFTEI